MSVLKKEKPPYIIIRRWHGEKIERSRINESCSDLFRCKGGRRKMGYIILIVTCILALIAVIMNLKALENNPYLVLKVIISVLLSFTALRYITLILYGDSPDYSLLNTLRYFYLASSMGITMTTASAVWYVTPRFREKIGYPYFLACFLPWILFYGYVIIKQPTEIVQGSQFGYQLILTGKFPFYLSIVQGSFVSVIVILCLIGIISYKHLQIRIQLVMIILAQMLLTLDGLSYGSERLHVFQPFTLTEFFALATTYYAFSIAIKSIHALKNE